MGLAWCKVSSLTSAVSRTLKGEKFPLTRANILAISAGKTVEGWEIEYFLAKALRKRSYKDVRSVMRDLEDWIEQQG